MAVLKHSTIGRIAPSPTGRMHIGNAYAALAAWLGARSVGGQVRLRIEDIDTPRVVADADRWIMDDLAWLGLDWDGPVVYQSQRIDLYMQAFHSLQSQCLAEGNANTVTPTTSDNATEQALVYPCFCSRADIRAASAPNEGDGFVIYPGTCRSIPTRLAKHRIEMGERHSWRIAVPVAGEQDAICHVEDRVYGSQSYDLPQQVGDVVLLRSDGIVSYQLAVTVDDIDMGICQVVRGRDLLRSTATQQWIRTRLGVSEPVEWAHLPLVDGADGRRLSKRYGSLDIGSLRERKVKPEQVLGLCAWLLGLQDRPEEASLHQLRESFSWAQVRSHLHDKILEDSLVDALS